MSVDCCACVDSRLYDNIFPCSIRRSKTLRTYAGDTSLPGGKMEPRDRNVEDTAVCTPSELFEEMFLIMSDRSTATRGIRRGKHIAVLHAIHSFDRQLTCR